MILGWWQGGAISCAESALELDAALAALCQPIFLLATDSGIALAADGVASLGGQKPSSDALPIIGYAPPLNIRNLGDPAFCADHGLRYPYMAGAMANGCSSVEMVKELGKNGMLGDFGSAGLPIEVVKTAIDRITDNSEKIPCCFNLIHSPNDSRREAELVELYLKQGIRCVSTAAYMSLTLPVVRYRVHGIRRLEDGRIVTPNRLIAKISRVEIAELFFSPPPERLLKQLVDNGDISLEQSQWAAQIPVAQDVIAEADSGGHTDNRPALTLIPTITTLRDRMQAQYGYSQKLRVGAGGGIGTPAAAAAAFSMGADFLVTGSVNQACVESGTSDRVRQLLGEAGQADVIMAPSADMFEMGVKAQVLKRGTLFPGRAGKLYEIYRTCDSLENIPSETREMIEKKFFQCTLDTVWEETRRYFTERDPGQIEQANRDPKHKMALVFRWYLGHSSRWAMQGDPTRQMDYQIWCGPAIGAFNAWTQGSFLEQLKERRVVTVALNLMYGAGVINRVNLLRFQGLNTEPKSFNPVPLSLEVLRERLA